MGELRIMGKPGDTKVMWNPANSAEVSAARKTFDDLKSKGFKAFNVSKKGEPGKEISVFDSQAGKLILVPPMAGGSSA
jgi:hypothetical protein